MGRGSLSAADLGFQLDGQVLWVERRDALVQQPRAAMQKVAGSLAPQPPAEWLLRQAERPEPQAELVLVQPQERLVSQRQALP